MEKFGFKDTNPEKKVYYVIYNLHSNFYTSSEKKKWGRGSQYKLFGYTGSTFLIPVPK